MAVQPGGMTGAMVRHNSTCRRADQRLDRKVAGHRGHWPCSRREGGRMCVCVCVRGGAFEFSWICRQCLPRYTAKTPCVIVHLYTCIYLFPKKYFTCMTN